MAAPAPMEAEVMKTVVVVGVDESEHSEYALEWTLHRFFCDASQGSFKLVVVHAKPSPASFVGFDGPGSADMLPFIDADLWKVAEMVVEKARKLCLANSVSALVEVVEGDARNVLCNAAEKHQADMLVVGSHGYGAIKRAFLGSVSDYCAHQAPCSVVIVKGPKQKQ
ncbi:universal stress protein A-like protein isoform X1 [Typha angustifolia]|uniref:universal stress protein A-like protein isoform X1 n=1 Tax=Typha angustifolia TaxID=59011 RepID=UPI003C2B56D4